MPWARLDDKMHGHRKFRRIGNDALALWVFALSFCADNLTDGRLTDEEVDGLLRLRKLEAAVLAELTAHLSGEHPLWHRTAKGYVIHDYLKYNPSKAQVLREREGYIVRQARAKVKRETNGKAEIGVTNHGVNNDVNSTVNTGVPGPGPGPGPKRTEGIRNSGVSTGTAKNPLNASGLNDEEEAERVARLKEKFHDLKAKKQREWEAKVGIVRPS